MHAMVSWSWLRTASLSIGRSSFLNLRQRNRNLAITSKNHFHFSNVREKQDDEETSVKTTDKFMDNKVTKDWTQYSTYKYERFAENSSHIIYDFDEEQRRLENMEETEEEKEKEKEGEVALPRGMTGVYDVEELVDLLRDENAKDIVALKVPSHIHYVDYMVIVTCKSKRHINALAQLVRKVYKKKKNKKDDHLIIEGKNTNWVALDMGNIALHIMDEELRELYDIETLWTVGPEYDDKCQEQEYKNPFDLYGLTIDPLEQFVSQVPDKTTKQDI